MPRRMGWALAFSIFGLCPLTFFNLSYPIFAGGGAAAVALLFVTIAVLAFETIRRAHHASEDRRNLVLEVREAYSAVEGTPVDLTIYQGATPTGHARGVIWFEARRLYFVGDRTSFGLTPSQVASSPIEWGSEPSYLPLNAHSAAGRMGLGITPLAGDFDSNNLLQARATLDYQISRWRDDRSTIQGQLPPLTLGPDVPTPLRLLLSALITTAFWIAALPVVALAISMSLCFVPAVFALGLLLWLVVPTVYSPLRKWLSWRDRRRLERAQWKT